MEDRIVVYVNTKPVALYRGMQVKHALISYHYPVYEACERGDLTVEHEQGFRVGLDRSSLPHDAVFPCGRRIFKKEGLPFTGYNLRSSNARA